MNTIIDKLDSITGWSGPIPVSLNEHEEFIAHNNSASTILTPLGNLNQSASLTLSTDLTGLEYIVIDCMSTYKGVNKLRSPADAFYLIDFGFQKYYFPAPSEFGPIRFRIDGNETITKIEITALHSDRDVLVLSQLQAIKERLPLDLTRAISESFTTTEYAAGTASATVGEKTITVTGGMYIDRYARVKLGTKYYGVESVNGGTITINSLYDGPTISETFNGSITMSPPVDIGNEFQEATLPAITVWSDAPSLIDVDNRAADYRVDTYKFNDPDPDSVDIVINGDNYAVAMQIDCESQYIQVLHDMVSVVKKYVAKRQAWVNGVQLELSVVSIQDDEGEYEKTSFIFAIEYAEESWLETQKFPMTGVLTITETVNQIQ